MARQHRPRRKSTPRVVIDTEATFGSQHVTAIRIFTLDMKTLTLRSLSGNNSEVWLPGEVKASVCNHARYHGVLKPEVGCTCGIWSCKSRRDLWRTFPFLPIFTGFKPQPSLHHSWQFAFDPKPPVTYVSAQVQQWGKVIEHEMGYRSEYARIIPETIAFWPRANKPIQKKLIKFLRTKYAQ